MAEQSSAHSKAQGRGTAVEAPFGQNAHQNYTLLACWPTWEQSRMGPDPYTPLTPAEESKLATATKCEPAQPHMGEGLGPKMAASPQDTGAGSCKVPGQESLLQFTQCDCRRHTGH
ncbi:Hypothetical predicted protein [Pelobates cultripes]|uniref:Uncharacterized protein n=1 Tax=Pelobates cultripes TaxID=61616 RepID=A0AAD1RHH8_PELCU|nr:Hypothetical predicted protein [Pelobates cultripes]